MRWEPGVQCAIKAREATIEICEMMARCDESQRDAKVESASARCDETWRGREKS